MLRSPSCLSISSLLLISVLLLPSAPAPDSISAILKPQRLNAFATFQRDILKSPEQQSFLVCGKL